MITALKIYLKGSITMYCKFQRLLIISTHEKLVKKFVLEFADSKRIYIFQIEKVTPFIDD